MTEAIALTVGQELEVMDFMLRNPDKPVSAIRMIRDMRGGASRCSLKEAWDVQVQLALRAKHPGA